MPHIPSSVLNAGMLAPLSSPGVSQPRSDTSKPDVPRTNKPKPMNNSTRPNRINIRTYDVDPDRVFEQLMGRKPIRNEHTGVTLNVNASGGQAR